MITALSTENLEARLETEDALSEIKKLGATHCELYLQTFYEYRPEFSKKFAAVAEGVNVCAVRVPPANYEAQLFSERRRTRGDGFYWLDQVLRSAAVFGAERYVLRGLTDGRDFGYLGERLNEVISFCARYGVKLSLENSCAGLYNAHGVFKELKNHCPELCGALDLAQARKSNYPYGMYINETSGSLSHVRLTDFDAFGKPCALGEGAFDFSELFSRLKDSGFDGTVIYGGSDVTQTSCLRLGELIYKFGL